MRPTLTGFAALAFLVVATDVSAMEDRQSILSDLRDNALRSVDIRTSDPFETMNVVSLEHFSGAELQALQDVLAKNGATAGGLMTAINANEMFEAALREQDVSLRTVRAVTRDGSVVTVYTNMPRE